MPLFKRKNKKAEEKKPAAKKSKKASKQQAPRKAAEKITPKKVNKKKPSGVVEKKTSKKGIKVMVPEKESTGKRVYHVAKRKEDGKWAVKFAGGEKAIKLFDTQAEAIAYTKKMSKNQDGAMLVHNSKGKNKGRIQ